MKLVDYFKYSNEELLMQKELLSKEKLKHSKEIVNIDTELVGIQEALRKLREDRDLAATRVAENEDD